MQIKQFRRVVPLKLFPVRKKKGVLSSSYRFRAWHLLLTLSVLIAGYLYHAKDNNKDTIEVKIKGHTINAEVADNAKEQALGLMFRKNLSDDSGMLFIFEQEARHSFWMKNTKIPLDIIWIDGQKNILHIEHSVPPCGKDPCLSYRPPKVSKYVLETNGGWAINNDISIGDGVSF